jgi:hypothetical protein
MSPTVSVVKSPAAPQVRIEGARRRHATGRMGTALEVIRTLLVLALIGGGIVMLWVVLGFARNAIGQ